MNRFRLALTAAITSATLGVAAEQPAFTPLFNGRDLSGWVNVNCAPETFTVRDGLLHCDGVPTGALRTERQYENFILELEWRHLRSGGNAGVFIWSGSLPAPGQPFLRAIEVQVLDHGYGKSDWFTTHGDVFPIHGSSMKPFSPNKGDRSFPREFRSKGTNEWNHYRIVATNGVLRLSVNGAEVSGGTDCNWRKGYIALESEGGHVDWRNIRIAELPSSNPPPSAAAPEAEPWDSLYDGRSLRGWLLPSEGLASWKASDWNLRSPAAAPASHILWSTAAPARSDLFLDWRWSKAPTTLRPPLVLRTGEGQPPIQLPTLDAARVDAWNRLQLHRRPTHFELELNGKPAGTIPVPQGPVQFGLAPAGVDLSVASPFVRR